MKRYSCYILKFMCLIALMVLIHSGVLHGIELKTLSIETNAAIDSSRITNDAAKQRMISDFHSFRIKNPMRRLSINWLKNDFTLQMKNRTKTITESELYEISFDLYSKYYNNRIELYNLNGTAYLYLNLKEAQTKQGAIQLKVNLPCFRDIWKQNTFLRKSVWHYFN